MDALDMPAHRMQGPADVKVFSVSLETPDGKLPPVKINVPDVPLGLADLAPLVFGLDDAAVNLAVHSAERSGRRLSCRSGCGQCCSQLVPVSAPEAIYIMETIFSESNMRAATFKRRFAEIRFRLEKNGLWEKLTHIDSSNNQAALAAEFWECGIACPFLVDNSCGIHSARPCACREYNVTSDPLECSQLIGANIQRIKIHQKMTSVLAKTTGLLLSSPPHLIPLTMIGQWYAEQSAVVHMRWMGIGLFDLLMECLSSSLRGTCD
jgi:Fe-S-cluster containining protein